MFTEGERITLLNDLCDFEQDLKVYITPPKTREIDILRRAIAFVRGSRGRWVNNFTTCNLCSFNKGSAEYRFCPNCGARMQK